MFLAARAVLLFMRASEDFGCAEKLSAAEQIKPDCCRTPAVVSIFTDSAACVLSLYHTTPLHYIIVAFVFSDHLPSVTKMRVAAGGWGGSEAVWV